MPEDDFDIYGEDEGDALKHEELEENLAHQDEIAEEPVPTVLSTTDPSVGEKRPREEDIADEPISTYDPAQAAPVKQGTPQLPNTPLKSEIPDVKMNGTHPNPPAGGQVVGGGMLGYDALYIGDLQWVRCPVV